MGIILSSKDEKIVYAALQHVKSLTKFKKDQVAAEAVIQKIVSQEQYEKDNAVLLPLKLNADDVALAAEAIHNYAKQQRDKHTETRLHLLKQKILSCIR